MASDFKVLKNDSATASLVKKLQDISPFFSMGTEGSLAPCVKTGLADFENLAHHLNRKFVRVSHHEREPFRSLEEKMVMAFFRMSRSILTSRSSFFSLANSAS